MIDQTDNVFDLNAVLHPGTVFDHPLDVVADTTLSLAEKRAILASWASDACAVEAAPDLRRPTSGPLVRFDEIMDALKRLDGEDAGRSRIIKRVRCFSRHA